MRTVLSPLPIPAIVQQHAEESAMLRQVRSVLIRAPHVTLSRLRRLDDRIAAHLDGLSVAGRYGSETCRVALERPGAGEVFAVTVRAIAEGDRHALESLTAVAAVLPDARRGLLSAFGWASAGQLQGLVRSLLMEAGGPSRELALDTCRLHGVDPGVMLMAAVQRQSISCRAAAYRAAGDLGRLDALAPVLAAVTDPSSDVAFWAARSGCLLGDRGDALTALENVARSDVRHREAASCLVLLATDFERGRELVRGMAKAAPPDVALKRRVIRACGWLGDSHFIPWLIDLMTDNSLSRLAGESFSLITGADLTALGLRSQPLENRVGASDGPANNDLAIEEDDGLPWPDRDRVFAWWKSNAARLPSHSCSFMGGPPTPENSTIVLRNGGQRQRIVAALRLKLQQPELTLFNVCAPAWRQQRLLGLR
jgi:uncharacterized protein (TIGR02270 family)